MCPPHFSKAQFRLAGIYAAAFKRSPMKLRRTIKQHAHQKGIIHRDLKPSKILVAPTMDAPFRRSSILGIPERCIRN